MKFTPGPTIAAASGSIGGTVFSRNRYGAYTRNRSIPVSPNTAYQAAAKNYLSQASQNWRALDADVRLSWATWAQSNPITDNLGQQQILQGNSAYVMLATRMLQMGQALPTVPPAVAAPSALLTLSATYDVGAGTTVLTFTATPLAAAERLWGYAAVTNSPARLYIKNLRKLVTISAAAQATGYDYEADVELRFGALAAGQVVTLEYAVADEDTGLISAFRRTSGTIVST